MERVQGRHPVGENAGASLDRSHLDGQDLAHQLLDGRITQVQPMSGQVEAKSLAFLGDRLAAQLGLTLEQNPRATQVNGRRDPGETSAKNDHLAQFFGHG